MRDFRRAFVRWLNLAVAVYPEAMLEVGERGIILFQSPPPIRKKIG